MSEEWGKVTKEELEAHQNQKAWQRDPTPATVESVQDIAPPEYQGDEPAGMWPYLTPLSKVMPFAQGGRSREEQLQQYSGPLIRAAKEEQGPQGPPVARQTILQKSMELEKGLSETPFGLFGVGMERTLYAGGSNVIDALSGIANMATDGYFAQMLGKKDHRKKLLKWKEDLKKQGDSELWASFKAMGKLWSEAPELPEPAEYIQSVLKTLTGVDVTTKEADELTAYFKPESTIEEKALRSIPEWATFSHVGKKIATRGEKIILKEGQQIYNQIRKKKGFKERDISRISVDETVEVIEEVVKSKFGSTWLPKILHKPTFRGLRRAGMERRAKTIIDLKKLPENHKRFNKLITRAEGKLASARTAKDKEAIALQVKNLNQLRSGRMRVPVDIRSVYVTETFSQFGGIVAGSLMGEENSWWGYLGGGLVSGIGHAALLKMGSKTSEYMSEHFSSWSKAVGNLTEDQREILIKQGKLPVGEFKEDQRDALQGIAFLLKSLPEEQRRAAYGEIKFLREVQKDLTDNYGISEELLETTIGKAMNLVPLIMIRDAVTAVKLDASKGIQSLGKEVAEIIKAENFSKAQLVEFRQLLNRLSGQASDAGYNNKKFTSFIAAMNGLSRGLQQEITLSAKDLTSMTDDIIAMLENPMMAQRFDSVETLMDLIEGAVKHQLLQRAPQDQYSLHAIQQIGPETASIARRILNAALQRRDVSNNLVHAFAPLHRDDEFFTPLANAGLNFGLRMIKKHTTANIDGREPFVALKSTIDPNTNELVAVDISKTLRGLYAENDAVSVYDVIIPELRLSNIKQRLAGTRIANKTILEAFANVSGKQSVIAALRHPELRREILKGMQEYNATKPLREKISLRVTEEGKPIPVDDADLNSIDRNVVRRFFEKILQEDLIEAEKRSFNDFDVWKILDDQVQKINEGKVTGLLPDLAIKVGLEDIHKISSNLNSIARGLYKKSPDQARKFSEVSKSFMNSIRADKYGEEIAGKINAAKDNWLKNVHDVWNNPDLNPIGYNIHRTRGLASYEKTAKGDAEEPLKKFIEDAHTWIDFEQIIDGTYHGSKGGVEAAEKLIVHLNMTFGRWDRNAVNPVTGETGAYVLTDPKSKAFVKNLMNAFLSRKISMQPGVGVAKEEAKRETIFMRKLLEEDRKRFPHLRDDELWLRQTRREKKFTDIEALRSSGIRRLAEEDLIDPDNVILYNNSVENYVTKIRGPRGLDNVQKELDKKVVKHAGTIREAIKLREAALLDLVKTGNISAGTRPEQYKQLYDFFVTSPLGRGRYDDIIEGFAENLGTSVDDAKKIVSDIVLEGLNESIRTQRMVTVGAGKQIDELDWDAFAAEVSRREGILKYISGEETFNGIKRLSQFMQIATRSSERISDLPVGMAVPKGLSFESYMSRIYAWRRNVVGLRWVLSEVALIRLRKHNASVLSELMKDPKAVDAVIELVERGGEVPAKVHARIQVALLTALANISDRENVPYPKEKESNIDLQMGSLRR